MKKKGLIVATIVMVLVLAVSLTTATYAWFTNTAATSIDGFTLSVTANNVVNIGLNKQGYTTYDADASGDSFVSGTVNYKPGTSAQAGTISAGYWEGTVEGLSATIDQDILWGAQSMAVGFSTAESAAGATYGNTNFADSAWKTIVKANGTTTKMDTAEAAYANINRDGSEATNGDFVHMFLGVQPTKFLQDGTNKLYIVVQAQGAGTTLGMATAIHVAYKVNGDSTWTDVDVFDKANTGAANDYHYGTLKTATSATITGLYGNGMGTGNGTEDSVNNETTFAGAAVVAIPLSNYSAGAAPLDQVQILIYIAGADEDCRDEAKAGQIGIGIFFGAQALVTTP